MKGKAQMAVAFNILATQKKNKFPDPNTITINQKIKQNKLWIYKNLNKKMKTNRKIIPKFRNLPGLKQLALLKIWGFDFVFVGRPGANG